MILGTSACHIMLGDCERAVPGLCGVTRDSSLGTVSIIGREADAHVLAEAVAALAHSDIIVTRTELFDGGCSLFVSPDRLLPALEITHRRFFR